MIKKESKVERVKSKESVYSNSEVERRSVVKRENIESSVENSPDKF